MAVILLSFICGDFTEIEIFVGTTRENDGLSRMENDLIYDSFVSRKFVKNFLRSRVPNICTTISRSTRNLWVNLEEKKIWSKYCNI